MYGIEYNGLTEKEHGSVVTKRPAVPATKRIYQTYSIPGADGDLYETDENVEDIKIEINLGFKAEPEQWMEKYRHIRKWLLGKGNGRLILSDDSEHFYKVKAVELGKMKRTLRNLGETAVVFVCDGYQYLLSGEREYTKDEILYNPYETCKPVYKINGEGTCVLNINGNEMKATIGQNLTIDTALMLSYREDGIMLNTSVTGDYEGLYLVPGENAISITDGFDLKVIPNWRCL